MTTGSFNFDLTRIKASIESGVVSFPRGLTGKQRRQFIRDRFHPAELHKGPSPEEIVRGLIHG